MNIRLLVTFNVKPEHIDTFIDAMQGAKSVLSQVPGCLSVEVLHAADEPHKVLLSEIWESREIHDQYAAKMAEEGSMSQMAPLLNGPPVQSVYDIK